MKQLKRLLFSLLIIGIGFMPWKVQAYPEPSNYANDWANVIDEDVEDKINDLNNDLEDINGSQIFVVTVDFLDGEYIDDYAYNLFNEWGIGSEEYDNGILLLLAIGEDNYYCLQGSGLEDTISTGVLQTILDDYLEPDFAIGNYSDGIDKTFEELYKRASKSAGQSMEVIPEAPSYNEEEGYDVMDSVMTIVLLAIVVIMIMVIIIVIISASRPRATVFGQPRTYRRPFIFYSGPRHHTPPRHDHYDRPRPSSTGFSSRSSSFSSSRSSVSRSSGGFRGGGGGSSRGGGAGRR